MNVYVCHSGDLSPQGQSVEASPGLKAATVSLALSSTCTAKPSVGTDKLQSTLRSRRLCSVRCVDECSGDSGVARGRLWTHLRLTSIELFEAGCAIAKSG